MAHWRNCSPRLRSRSCVSSGRTAHRRSAWYIGASPLSAAWPYYDPDHKERLAEKGLLQRGNRQGVGGADTYAAAIGEQEFVAKRLAGILSAIERDYPAVLAQYLDRRAMV